MLEYENGKKRNTKKETNQMQAIIVFESYEKYFIFARVCAS